jgi:hypothetical protein
MTICSPMVFKRLWILVRKDLAILEEMQQRTQEGNM